MLDRLQLHLGDTVRLGTASFRVAGVLTHEPDRVATAAILGARVLIAAADLPSTGLISPGAMVRYAIRLTASDPERIAATIPTTFPHQGWRIRDPRDAAPGVTRFIEQVALFLTLVGLTSLLVGGIGVANGVRAWLDARARTIAILRCLGASPAAGVHRLPDPGSRRSPCSASSSDWSLAHAADSRRPFPRAASCQSLPCSASTPGPLALAAGYGILIALCFALWPLGRAARIPGGALFRDGLLPDATRPATPLIVVNAVLALALVGLTVASATDRVVRAVFLPRRWPDPDPVPRQWLRW